MSTKVLRPRLEWVDLLRGANTGGPPKASFTQLVAARDSTSPCCRPVCLLCACVRTTNISSTTNLPLFSRPSIYRRRRDSYLYGVSNSSEASDRVYTTGTVQLGARTAAPELQEVAFLWPTRSAGVEPVVWFIADSQAFFFLILRELEHTLSLKRRRNALGRTQPKGTIRRCGTRGVPAWMLGNMLWERCVNFIGFRVAA